MRKSIFTSFILLSFAALSGAQPSVSAQNSNAFQADQQSEVFSFRLPQNANVHDLIYVTTENGVIVKRYEIDKSILASGKFSFSSGSIPGGTYIVSVASNSLIKYRFKFINKGKVTTVTLKDSKLILNVTPSDGARTTASSGNEPTTPAVVETAALTFNSRLKEFTVSSGIPFRAGTKIEVFNANHTLIATKDVTEDMVLAKKYSIKVDQLQPGSYFVNVDDVKFGGVTYSD